MEKIVCEGYVSSYDEISINMSEIYTRLIQEAGRWCEDYASDLLYDLDSIRRCVAMKSADWVKDRHWDAENGCLLFRLGFRKGGVDHREWIESNQKERTREYHYYRAIWELKGHIENESKVIFELRRID